MKKSGEFWLINGIVHDAVHKRPLKADILVKRGKIAAIGKCTGTKVVDLKGLEVFPGLVEAHCHLGLDGWSNRYDGKDYNEVDKWLPGEAPDEAENESAGEPDDSDY